jgi:hypothetical protein
MACPRPLRSPAHCFQELRPSRHCSRHIGKTWRLDKTICLTACNYRRQHWRFSALHHCAVGCGTFCWAPNPVLLADDGLTPTYTRLVAPTLMRCLALRSKSPFWNRSSDKDGCRLQNFGGVGFHGGTCCLHSQLRWQIFVVAEIVLNAIGTGALSGPYDRYLARVVWLILFVGLVSICCIMKVSIRTNRYLSVTARAERDPGVVRPFLVLPSPMLQRRHRLFGATGSACTIVRWNHPRGANRTYRLFIARMRANGIAGLAVSCSVLRKRVPSVAESAFASAIARARAVITSCCDRSFK